MDDYEALQIWDSKEKTMQVTQRDGSKKTIPDLEFADRDADTVEQCQALWQWLVGNEVPV